MNEKYDEPQKQEFPQGTTKQNDILIGNVHKISCGIFNHKNEFESADLWSFENSDPLPKISYQGQRPKRFRVSLTARQPSHEPDKREWVEILAPNIRGLILEEPTDKEPDLRVLFFVLDKPPDFFHCIQINPRSSNPADKNPSFSRSRLVYPAIAAQDGPRVFNVPWAIQYSRVFRIEYERRGKLFDQVWYLHRLSRKERETVYCFSHPTIVISRRSVDSMVKTLEVIMKNIERMFWVSCVPECRLAVLQLLYNGNLSPISEEIIDHISLGPIGRDTLCFFQGNTTRDERREFCEAYQASAQLMGTTHLRALRRLHGFTTDTLKTPQTLKGTTVEPRKIIQEQIVIF
jgi:hypothetical protein